MTWRGSEAYRDDQKPQPEWDWAMRKCLSCGEDFKSSWIGHRICRRCKQTEIWIEESRSTVGPRVVK